MGETRNGISSKTKISKGYRLKMATHNKIKELQAKTSSSQEKVISRAIRLYSQKIQSKLKQVVR